MSRFLDVLTGDVLAGGERDRDELDARLPESDPLAIFHQLDRAAAPAAASDVSAMKAAVAELRRARELSRRSDEITGEFPVSAFASRSPEQPRLAPPSRRAGVWRLPAAAAALFATLVFFGGPGAPGPVAAVASAPAASEAAPAFSEAAAASYLPLVEDLDPRQAEMIQIEDEGVSLVVVLAAGSV